jgi:hypothetical protein
MMVQQKAKMNLLNANDESSRRVTVPLKSLSTQNTEEKSLPMQQQQQPYGAQS